MSAGAPQVSGVGTTTTNAQAGEKPLPQQQAEQRQDIEDSTQRAQAENLEKFETTPVVRIPRVPGTSVPARFINELSGGIESGLTPTMLPLTAVASPVGEASPLASRAIGAIFTGLGLTSAYQNWKAGRGPEAAADLATAGLGAVHAANPDLIPGLFKIGAKVEDLEASGAPETARAYAEKEMAAHAQEQATKAATPSLTPALMVDGKPEVAQPGETHAQIAARLNARYEVGDPRRDPVNNAVVNDANHVFVDHEGNVLDRRQAADAAVQTGQITPEQYAAAMARSPIEGTGLHSEDLNQKEGEPNAPEEVTGSVGPGAAHKSDIPQPGLISIANAKVNQRRAAEGNLPILNDNPKANKATFDEAEKRIDTDRDYGSKIIDQIRDGTKTSVDVVEEAALAHEAVTIRNARNEAAKLAGDPNATEEERAQAAQDWRQHEARLNELDEATKMAGTSAARVMQFRQQQIADDYTVAGIERKARAAKGRPLTPEEVETTKTQAAEIETAQGEAATAATKHSEATRTAADDATHEETKQNVQSSEKKNTAAGKTVDVAKQRTNIVDAMKSHIANGGDPKDLYDFVQKLHENLQREAIRKGETLTRDQVTNKVHDILTKDVGLNLPKEFTGREGDVNTHDLISGIGRRTPLTTDPAKLAKMEIREQAQKVGKINRFLQKIAAPFTGAERKPTSAESRALEKEGRELAKKNGVQVTDPAKQLKTSLEAAKTRYKNQIADLNRAIGLREPLVPKTGQVALDAEGQSLKAQRDAKLAEYKAVFGDPSMTDEARLKVAMAAAERASKAWDERLADAKKGIFDKAQPGRKVTSLELKAIKARSEAAKSEVAELRAHDQVQVAAAQVKLLASKQEAIKKDIAGIQAKIGGAKPDAKGAALARPAHPEIEPLLQERDALRIKLADTRQKQGDDAAMQRRLDAINKEINEKTAKLAAGDLSTNARGQKISRPLPNPKLEKAQQRLDEVNKQMAEARKAARTVADPYQTALRSRKTYLDNRAAELLEKLSRNDFSKPAPRAPLVPDDELRQKQAVVESLKQEVDIGHERERLANRPTWQKTLEQVAGAARASALSGYHTLIKLASYDVSKIAVQTPAEELTGAALSKVPGLSPIFKKANLESGSTIKALGDFYTNTAIKGMRAAWQVLKTGTTESKTLHGKPVITPPRWYDFFGRLHFVEKAPLFTGTEAMYIRRATEAAARAGLDVSDEFVRGQINKEAFDYSQKSILQENNKFADAVNGLQARLEAVNPKTGRVDIDKATLSTVVKTLLTKGIVRTPANYFSQVIKGSPLGLITGVGKAAMAHVRGIDTLHPVEANAIAGLLKVGAVGTAMFTLGAIDGTRKKEDRIFGGYWEPGRKRDDGDVPWGQLRIDGHVLPHIVTHNPLTEEAQMGSTMMRVALSRFRKGDKETEGMTSGAVKAVIGLAGKAPIASPLMRMGQENTNIAGELLSGLVPQLMENIAEDTDPAKSRSPKTTEDYVKMDVPGMREQVPQTQTSRPRKLKSFGGPYKY
jgi:hypothetical protein